MRDAIDYLNAVIDDECAKNDRLRAKLAESEAVLARFRSDLEDMYEAHWGQVRRAEKAEAERTSMRKIIDACHLAIGEDPGSDDESMPEIIAKKMREWPIALRREDGKVAALVAERDALRSKLTEARGILGDLEFHMMSTNTVIVTVLDSLPAGPCWGTIVHEMNQDLEAIGRWLYGTTPKQDKEAA